jgi:hypothetical protein
MKKSVKSKAKAKQDVTLTDFFALVDKVAKKAKTDPSARKLIDAAVQKWQSDSRYAI